MELDTNEIMDKGIPSILHRNIKSSLNEKANLLQQTKILEQNSELSQERISNTGEPLLGNKVDVYV